MRKYPRPQGKRRRSIPRPNHSSPFPNPMSSQFKPNHDANREGDQGRADSFRNLSRTVEGREDVPMLPIPSTPGTQCCPRSSAPLSETPSMPCKTRIQRPKLPPPKPDSSFLPSRFWGFSMKSGRLEKPYLGQAGQGLVLGLLFGSFFLFRDIDNFS